MMVMKKIGKLMTFIFVLMIIITSFATVSQAASSLKISNEKTDSVPQTQTTTVSNTEIDIPKPKSYLKIVSPSQMDEGEVFDIFVFKISNGASEIKPVPLENVLIQVGWDENNYYTDLNGRVVLLAPLVVSDQSFIIRASKNGYYSDEVNILVKNIPSQLCINAPDSVLEGYNFDILITADNETVSGAFVVFNGETKLTNYNGSVSFTAPQVTHNTVFSIFAYKSGYLNVSSSITVLDMPPLEISATSEVYEGTVFGVLVTACNQSVVNATVFFNGQIKYTGFNGSVSFIAPEVTNDTNFIIHASKTGYIDAFHIITVLNLQNIPLITFFMDNIANTLTVASVDPNNVLWSDILINGSCNTSELGTYVTAGDFIFNCQGTIVIIYLPTYTLLGQFNFTSDLQLEIVAPSSVYEFQNFTVLIKVEGHPVTNASVLFNGLVKYTIPLGVVSFTAPEVNQSTVFLIKAFKEGYLDATAEITVISMKTFGSFSI